MPKRRLLWQFYPAYVILALAAVAASGLLAARWFEQFHLRTVEDDLSAAARAVAEQVATQSKLSRSTQLTRDCGEVGRIARARIRVFSPAGEILCDTGGASEFERAPDQARLPSAAKTNRWIDTSHVDQSRVAHVALPVRKRGTAVAVVETSRSLAALDAAVSTIRWRIGALGICVAVLAAGLSPLVTRQIARPLAEMRKAAERFARAEFGYKLPVPDAEELAGLAEALNQMAEQLQARIGTIVRQSNEQQAVLGSMIEGVLAVDNEHRIISLNKASAHLLGLDPVQARGRRLQEVVRNADLRRFITRALTCDDPIDDDVVLHGDHEGVLQARGAALHDAAGRAIGAVVVLNDVTEFRRLEHIRRDFVANVSHELKTPITSIKGFVETLLDGAIRNPVDAERFLRIIAKQADRLHSIIEDLLSLSKIEQGEEESDIVLEPGPVKDVLESAVHNCEMQAADREIEVCVNCSEALAASLNQTLLEEALINLLDNAIKYSEPGKTVHVSALETDDEVQISVEDRGCGIPAEHLPRIFERFYRVDRARSRKLGGTGLGLAIVKHIVQAHHGRITVKSSAGVGSTFTIYLPRFHRPLARASLAG